MITNIPHTSYCSDKGYHRPYAIIASGIIPMVLTNCCIYLFGRRTFAHRTFTHRTVAHRTCTHRTVAHLILHAYLILKRVLLANSTFIWYFNATRTHGCVERIVSVTGSACLPVGPVPKRAAVNQPILLAFLFLYGSDPIIVLRRLMFSSSSSLKQLIVSSIKEVIDKIE